MFCPRHTLASGAQPSCSGALEDYGAEAGFEPQPDTGAPQIFANPPQAFVKFLGESSNRADLSLATVDELKRTGCHWAVAYPKAGGKRRPSGVQDGAVMFISPFVKGSDIRVFGRAVAMNHQEGRDDATPTDIEQHPWKSKWPRYIRVHHAEFVAGTMGNGISLGELMARLGDDSFVSTQRNAKRGLGNTNPRRAFMQQPAVELTTEAGWHGVAAHNRARPPPERDRRGRIRPDAHGVRGNVEAVATAGKRLGQRHPDQSEQLFVNHRDRAIAVTAGREGVPSDSIPRRPCGPSHRLAQSSHVDRLNRALICRSWLCIWKQTSDVARNSR